MKKEIIVSIATDTGEIKMKIEGLSPYEVIGVLDVLKTQIHNNMIRQSESSVSSVDNGNKNVN